MGGWGLFFVFFYLPLGIFISMSSGVIQALPCFRAFLLLYKKHNQVSRINGKQRWLEVTCSSPSTDRRHVKRRLAEPFGYSVTCALIGP